MSRLSKLVWIGLVALLAVSPVVRAATPPQLVDYQGVLRDSAGSPLDGSFGMVFGFYDDAVAGNEILVDAHVATPVDVTGGLFSVQLGGGDVTDGTGPGSYATIGEVFRDFSEVWLAIQVEGEILTPRLRVVSTAYSLNADHLDGLDSSSLLRSDASGSFSNGTLTLEPGTTLSVEGAAAFAGGLTLGGALQAGSVAQPAPAYNSMGSGTPEATWLGIPQMLSSNDLYVSGSVEVDGRMFLNGDLIMDDDGDGAGGSSVQTIWFNRLGSPLGASLQWDPSADRLSWSDDLSVGQELIAGRGLFSQMLRVPGEIRMGSEFVEGDQEIYFADGGDPQGEYFRWNEAGDAFNFSDDILLDAPQAAIRHITSSTVPNFTIESTAETMQFCVSCGDGDIAAGAFTWHLDVLSPAGRMMVLQSSDGGDLYIGGQLTQNTNFDIAEAFFQAEPVEPGDLVRVDPRRPDSVLRSAGVGDASVIGVVSSKPGIVLGGSAFTLDEMRETWGDAIAETFSRERAELEAEALIRRPELAARREALTRRDAIADAKELDVEAASAQYTSDLEFAALQRFFERRFAAVALAGRVPVKVDSSFGAIRVGDPLAPSPIPGVAMRATEPGPVVGTALQSFSDGRGRIVVLVHRGHYAAGEPDADRVVPGPVESSRPEDDSASARPSRAAAESATETPFTLSHGVRQPGGRLAEEIFRVDEQGNVYARGSFRPASMDLAEYFALSESAEPGDVLVADREVPGRYRLSFEEADPAVVGVVSTRPGVLLGADVTRIASDHPELARRLEEALLMDDREAERVLWRELEARFEADHAAVALGGTVPCKVDAGYGEIRIGDLLTTSPTPGHAKRADEARSGTILGKALEPWSSGKGVIRILVMAR